MSGWSDVRLTDPPSRDGEISVDVLIITDSNYMVSGFTDYCGEWYDINGDHIERVTHWKKLPDLPNSFQMSKPDWKDAPKWANWLAMDKDGEWCWWNKAPRMADSIWAQGAPEEEFTYESAGYFESRSGWMDSLEQRP